MNGWIKLHRTLLNWEWYGDIKTCRLFLHILIKSNHEPKKWQGITINRGELVTSYSRLASETGLTVQNVRTSLKNLISTGELTRNTSNKYTLITVNRYEIYQETERPTGELTNKQQTNNKQLTNN